MPSYFLDSSAIAKRYITETGSAWVVGVMHPLAGNQLHVARISGAEVMAAIARRIRAGNLTLQAGRDAALQFRSDFATALDLIEISASLIARAMDLAERYVLRGYDAVQLAAALAVHDTGVPLGLSTTLVSADDELNAAALAEGLQVENPNLHP
jgi:predicted nucleic acid-binding protein